tara:strand:- start:341 stop:559 length:219 start_codon:yes stop_codon:yes gene_type:complete
MIFLSYHYDNIYSLLKKHNRVMKLKDAMKLILMPKINFKENIPKRYKDKMIVFEIEGEEHIFIPTKEMVNNE